jgi:hypothetical protein
MRFLPAAAIPPPPAVRCSSVLLYGFKRDLNAYLAGTPGAPHHTLAEIVAFNSTFVPPMKYGQAIAAAAAQVDISRKRRHAALHERSRVRPRGLS